MYNASSIYLSFMAGFGITFYSALRDSVIKAMKYGGLQETTAWKMLPSQGVDTCKYKNIDVTAGHSLIGTFSVGSCANFTTHYADSLKLRPSCN